MNLHRNFFRCLGLLLGLLFCTTSFPLEAQTPGALDTSFSPILTNGFNGEVRKLVVQPDGKVLVSGNFSTYQNRQQLSLTRLNADGSTDTSFRRVEGFEVFTVNDMAVLPDGKILVGGYFPRLRTQVSQSVEIFQVLRLHADGSLDTDFDAGSLTSGFVSTLALLPNGKIVVGGRFTVGSEETQKHRIVRLNADGGLDESFDSGVVFGPDESSGSLGLVECLTLSPDGKILIGGSFETYNGLSAPGIARIHPDGSLDMTFNAGSGITGGVGGILDIKITPTGQILIGGSFTKYNGTTRNYIALIEADGSLSPSFNSLGFQAEGALGFVHALLIRPDGKILVGGKFKTYNGVDRGNIALLAPNGLLDNSFASGPGFTNPEIISWSTSVQSLALTAQGNIIAGGNFFNYHETRRRNIAQLSADGDPDLTFNGIEGLDGEVSDIVFQPDGKILLAGNFRSFALDPARTLVRRHADGSPDLSFDANASQVFSGRGVGAIALQDDGKILAVGDFSVRTDTGLTSRGIVRLHPDGSLDTSFQTGTGFEGFTYDVAMQSDGKILIAGSFSTYNGQAVRDLVRLHPDGSLDTSFEDGFKTSREVFSILIEPDDKIIIGGNFNEYQGTLRTDLARLHPNGRLDKSFIPETESEFGRIFTLARQADGKILAGGSFTNFEAGEYGRVVRFNADGRIDRGFNPGTGFDDDVFSIVVQADQKILVGGRFKAFRDQTQFGMVRLYPDGNLDEQFTTGTGFISNVNIGGVSTLAITAEGQVYAGGAFQFYDQNPVDKLVRLSAPNEDFFVEGFSLINADTGQPILDYELIRDGAQINLLDLPTSDLSISARTLPGPVGSVKLQLDGPETQDRVENRVPYALFGGAPPRNFTGKNLPVGQYQLEATPYAGENLTGTVGTTRTLNFEFFELELLLLAAPTGDTLQNLRDGDIIALSGLGTDFLSIQALPKIAQLDSIEFSISGPGISFDDGTRQEKLSPYVLFGDKPNGTIEGRNFQPGEYSLEVVAYPNQNTLKINFTIIDSIPTVESFTLINAETQEEVGLLANGATIDLTQIGDVPLNIQANTSPAQLGSVHFKLNDQAIRTENIFPYALFGNDPFQLDFFLGEKLALGNYQLTAQAYSEAAKAGLAGPELTINFSVIKPSAGAKISLFPNPTSEKVHLSSTEMTRGTFKLYNPQGELIYEEVFQAGLDHQLDVKGLQSGVYLIRVVDEQSEEIQRRIIVE